jgi:2-haloalkanoic acid dehalogenase type II
VHQTKAVIFDRDGVLCHFDLEAAAVFFRPLVPLDVEALVDAWLGWQRRHGLPGTLEEERTLLAGFWAHLARQLDLPADRHRQLQQFDYTTLIRPFPEVRDVLATLRGHGLRCGVLSNFSLASIDASLEAAGLADLVDVACAGPVVGAMKPDPAAYRIVMNALGAAPGECLLFDDELVNVTAARALGIAAYWVDRSRAEDALEEGTVRDLSSCLALLDGGA